MPFWVLKCSFQLVPPLPTNDEVSRLTLVDLAGAESMERAHGGAVDAAGVGTNMGLLVLGRVIRALAEGSDTWL